MLRYMDVQSRIRMPSLIAERGPFLIKFAETQEEVESALRLRYEVFNLEQGKGLKEADEKGIDSDEFDEFCLHLIVVEKSSRKAVGTYRIHLGPLLCSSLGFYSSREYEIRGLDEISGQLIEVGRSCVAPQYRSGSVVALLWTGISEILFRSRMRYLFGCASLESTDAAIAWTLYDKFRRDGALSETLSAKPAHGFALARPLFEQSRHLSEEEASQFIPPLLKGYLRIGAQICGEPACDKEFGTIDFLIMLDRLRIPSRYGRHFKVQPMNAESKTAVLT